MTPTPAESPAARFPRPWCGPLLVVWALVMVGFMVLPVYKVAHTGEWKDYDIWYDTGQIVLNHAQIYPTDPKTEFVFMYPPPAATLLAPLTAMGKAVFVLTLDLINCAAWVVCVLLCVYLVAGTLNASWMLYVLPSVCCVAYIWDTYFLGQPNLVLLAMLLGAFVCLRSGRPWGAGLLVALAAAFKAFPITALVYLIYRRQWKAAGATLVFLTLFLFLLPAPLRGWGQNLQDLKTWSRGMLFTYNGNSIAQRPDISYQWKNQSIIASAHRLLRHVPADVRKETVDGREVDAPIYANLVDLDFKWVNLAIVAGTLVIGLGYIAAMPRFGARTPRTDTIEYAMLLVLMIVFSPLSWYYYGVWLLLAFTMVTQFILEAPPGSRERMLAMAWLAGCLLLFNLVLKLDWIRPIRALGITFWGDLLLLSLLGWMLRGEATERRSDEAT